MNKVKINSSDLIWYVFFISSLLLPPVIKLTHYIMTGLLLLWTIIRGRFRLNRKYLFCLIWFLLFAVYISVSKLWAIASVGNQETIITTIVESVIVLYCILEYISDKMHLHRLIEIFVNSMVVIAIAYYVTSPLDTWGTERMGTWLSIWRNAAGYYFGFASVMVIYIYYYKKEKILLLQFLFLTIAALGTGSRKVFLLYAVALLCFAVLQPRLIKKAKWILGGGIVVVAVVLILFQIPAFRDIYLNRILALLQGEDSTEASTLVRLMLQDYAMDLFRRRPAFGWGLEGFYIWLSGQIAFLRTWNMSPTYSHCNYTELLANFGVIGFGLYYLFPVLKILQGIKYRSSPLVRFGLIIVITCLVLDIGTVGYYFKFSLYILWIGLISIIYGIMNWKEVSGCKTIKE